MFGFGFSATSLGVKGGVSDAADGGAFSPLSLSPFAMLLPTSGNTSTDAGGSTPATADDDPVGRVTDLSGNGRHLPRYSADTRRPLLQISDSYRWLKFDGTDDLMRVTWTAVSQPFTRISVVRQISWTAADRLWDGGTGDECAIYQTVSSPNLGMGNPSGPHLSGEDVGSWLVITERHYGAGVLSSVAVDNGSYVSSTAWLGKTISGFCLGGHGNLLGTCGNFDWGGVVMFDKALTDDEISKCRTYMGALVGKVL